MIPVIHPEDLLTVTAFHGKQATITDHTQRPYIVNRFMAIMLLFTSITLLIYDGVPRWLLFAAFCISGASYAGQATNFAWANVACQDDDQLRAVVLASMNMWSNVFVAWWGLAFCKLFFL